MEIKIRVSQHEAIKMGLNQSGYIPMEVDIAALTVEEREELAKVSSYDSQVGTFFCLDLGEWSVAGLKTALAQRQAKAAAEAAKDATEVEKEVQRLLALPQAEFDSGYLSNYSPTLDALKDPRLAGKVAHRTAYQRALEEVKRRVEADARARGEAAQASRAAEDAAKAEARQLQREEWVAAHGSANQQARLAAGLLPVTEVEEALAEEAFAPLASVTLYERMTARDVCTCEYDPPCHVDFSSERADSATPSDWEQMLALGNVLPHAVLELREHRGVSSFCERTETRKGVKVTVTVGAYRFSREYAV